MLSALRQASALVPFVPVYTTTSLKMKAFNKVTCSCRHDSPWRWPLPSATCTQASVLILAYILAPSNRALQVYHCFAMHALLCAQLLFNPVRITCGTAAGFTQMVLVRSRSERGFVKFRVSFGTPVVIATHFETSHAKPRVLLDRVLLLANTHAGGCCFCCILPVVPQYALHATPSNDTRTYAAGHNAIVPTCLDAFLHAACRYCTASAVCQLPIRGAPRWTRISQRRSLAGVLPPLSGIEIEPSLNTPCVLSMSDSNLDS